MLFLCFFIAAGCMVLLAADALVKRVSWIKDTPYRKEGDGAEQQD